MKRNIWVIMGLAILITLIVTTIPKLLLGQIKESEVSIDEAWKLVRKFDKELKEFDKQIKEKKPEVFDECPFIKGKTLQCQQYQFDKKRMLKIEQYIYGVDLHAYYLENNSRILKWDFGQNNNFEAIEYDIDGDGISDYGVADMNTNGKFDEEEIYRRDDTGRLKPIIPKTLPYPPIPVTIY